MHCNTALCAESTSEGTVVRVPMCKVDGSDKEIDTKGQDPRIVVTSKTVSVAVVISNPRKPACVPDV